MEEIALFSELSLETSEQQVLVYVQRSIKYMGLASYSFFVRRILLWGSAWELIKLPYQIGEFIF